jgi:pimeloyl-ACP methyl ester carboxylesterase
LLDALGIQDKVIVAGISAGALSAMQFAIKYPERVSALLLLVPDSWASPSLRNPEAQEIAGSQFVMKTVFRSDFAAWAFMKLAKGAMLTFMGVPKALQHNLSAADAKATAEVMNTILPVSQRYAGILNDAINSTFQERYALERISAPTLIVDTMDVVTFPGSKYTAEQIPNARLVAYETGGHLLIGHGDEVVAAVQDFLAHR